MRFAYGPVAPLMRIDLRALLSAGEPGRTLHELHLLMFPMWMVRRGGVWVYLLISDLVVLFGMFL